MDIVPKQNRKIKLDQPSAGVVMSIVREMTRMRAAYLALGLVIAMCLILVTSGVATASEDAGVHQPAVDVLDSLGVIENTGCSESTLCPNDPMPRWEIAVWFVRVLDGDDPVFTADSRFEDVDEDDWWYAHVERLANLEVTKGCSTDPPNFCPNDPVTRGQMAAFLSRAFDLEDSSSAGFTDVPSDHVFASVIDALASAGITVGCASEPKQYCPSGQVTRGEMATFLARALGLVEIPSPIAATFSDVSTGGFHTCGVRMDGSVGCWGNNEFGQTNAVSGVYGAASSGLGHSCGLTGAGVIRCWGLNDDGQADAPSGSYLAVSAGGFHTCALRTEHSGGGVRCWGFDGDGQADAPSGSYMAVSVGGFHTCGVRRDGSVVCWGNNEFGEANAPSGTYRTVSAGGFHTCGVRRDGSVVCWGNNEFGQASAPSGTYRTVSAGGFHTCGVRRDGSVVCWGNNEFGQASAPSGTYVAVSAGRFHACGLTTQSEIVCWGDNAFGQANVDQPST